MGQGKYKRNRPDKDGHFRAAFDKNKKIIYATQTVCAICGKPVDFSLKFPEKGQFSEGLKTAYSRFLAEEELETFTE